MTSPKPLNCDISSEEKGMILEEKVRELNERELKLMEEFFTLQNEVLTELGGIIQQHLESRNAKSQEILSKLYDQVQRNSELTKKLSKIQSQTNSLHESVMGACMQ